MTLSKNATNLVGGLAVGAILVLAIVAGALPMIDRAATTREETERVSAANDIQRVQIDALAAKEAELPTLLERVGKLSAQMPSASEMESVVRVASEAASDSIQLQKIEPQPVTAFVPRQEPRDLSESATAAPDDAEPADAAELLQIPVTIVAGSTSLEAAVAYLDALRAGPRLIGADSAVIIDEGDEEFPYTVTLQGRVFVVAG